MLRYGLPTERRRTNPSAPTRARVSETVSLTEAARVLRVSRWTLWRARTGRGRFRTRLAVTDLMAWVRSVGL